MGRSGTGQTGGQDRSMHIAFSMVSGVSPVTLSSKETHDSGVLKVAAFLTRSLRKCEEKVSPGYSLTCVEVHPDV